MTRRRPKTPKELPEKYIGIAEAAEYAGVSQRTFTRWISQGHFTVYRPGGRMIRINQYEIDDFYEFHAWGGPAQIY